MIEGDARLLLLHKDDNVLICTRPIAAGEPLALAGGGTMPAPEAVAIGHKVARVALRAGDKILRYGAPIGSMTMPAAAGDWVHMHNMKSDYIASHTRAVLKEGQ